MSSQTALLQDYSNQAHRTLPAYQIVDTQELLLTALKYYQASSAPRLLIEQVEQLRNNACAVANRILELDPTTVDAMNILARVALDRNDLATANHWASSAQAFDDKSSAVWYTLGHIYLAQHHLQRAERAFVRCLELDGSVFRAHTSYAYTKLQQGDVVAAFEHYRKLANIQSKDGHVRSKLFECLRQLQADYDNPSLADSLCQYLQWDDVNHNDLATITASLLRHRYQLDDKDSTLDIARLASDKLLLLALEKLIFTDPAIEKVLTAIREHLFFSELQQPHAAHQQLIAALAFQGYNNEYVYSVSEAEAEQLNALNKQFEKITRNDIFRKQHQLLLLAMYQSLQAVIPPAVSQVIRHEQWLPALQPVMQKLLPKQGSTNTVPSLGNITNAVSCAVKEQYEHNPYPRWLALEYHTPTTYDEALHKALLGFSSPPWVNNNPIKVLIAGCGTGRHALQVARYFRNVEVLAVDISLSSLNYAKAMADRYNLPNITFLQADILDLHKLQQKFHIIECSGVLHHMENPSVGAQQLKKLLVADGLLKIGLYSEIARSEVVACRELINEDHLSNNEVSIRQLRKRLLEQDCEKFPHILRSPDFYSMSGCRDLLFHVQEHRLTVAQIQNLVEGLDMDFLGFIQLPSATRLLYAQAFPDDKNMTCLANWDVFEQAHPDTFAAMYQFYLK